MSAKPGGGGLLLLRAAEAKTLPGPDPTEAQVKVVSEAEAYLARIRKRLTRRERVTFETAVWYGPAAHAIVEAARIRTVDQVVSPRAEGAAIQTPSGESKPWEAR